MSLIKRRGKKPSPFSFVILLLFAIPAVGTTARSVAKAEPAPHLMRGIYT